MIGALIELSPEEKELIAKVAGDPPTDGACWGNDELSAIRTKIKQFYVSEQEQVCCYCELEYPAEHGLVWCTEHIIPRALNPKWTFEPRNLAASCPECNGGKGISEVRKNPNAVNFPDHGDRYKIVHPHFDDWDAHLRRLGKLYVALDGKGTFTISCCNLFRFAERKLKRCNPIRDRRFDESVGELFFAESVEDAEPELARIVAIIKQARNDASGENNADGDGED